MEARGQDVDSGRGALAGGLGRRIGLAALVGCGGPAAPEPQTVSGLPPLAEVAAGEAPRGPERPARTLSITFVGEVRGELEPCGCPTLPFGGFSRRERLLERLRAEGPLLHLDAGELLLKGDTTTRSEDRARRAEALLRLSHDVGVDAWVPGPTDLLALGLDGLLGLDPATSPPAISATWRRGGAALLPPTRVIERDGLRVGLIGLSGAPADRRAAPDLELFDPVAATRAALEALPADLDLIVAIGSLGDEAAERVARLEPGPGLVLSTRGLAVDDPKRPLRADGRPGALIVESPDRGRYVQEIQLRLGSTAGEPVVLTQDPQRWRDWQTARHSAEPGAAADARAQALQTAVEAEGRGRNLALVSTIPLSEDLDGGGGVAAAALAEWRQDAVALATARAAAPTSPLAPGYAAASACVNCHAPQFARWSFSDHAKAWEALLKRKAVGDPDCVACHSTGFGQPGGFGDVTSSDVFRFKAVQCEACHGPLRDHPDDPRVKARPITEATCTGCHDPANSPQFDFATYLPRASCQL
jgi:hypothetical protein